MAMKRCAVSPLHADFSLCGVAFDAFDSGDMEEEYAIAGEKESITCPECCRSIQEIKALRNPLRPRREG